VNTRQIFQVIKEHWHDRKFVIHKCTFCDYECGYYWEKNQLLYSSGCFCLIEREKPRLCSDDELLKYIKNNMDLIWEKFHEEKINLS